MRSLNRTELAVLAVLVVVLLAIGLPWVLRSRGDARLDSCRYNLAQIGRTLNEQMKSNGNRFPAATFGGEMLPPERRLAWTVPLTIARQSEGGKSNFDPSLAWDKEPNLTPEIDGQPFRSNTLFRCPADDNANAPDQLSFSSYVGMAGIGNNAATLPAGDAAAGIFGYERRTTLADLGENREHIVCVIDTSRNNGPWTAGGDPTVRPLLPDDSPFIGDGRQFGGHHTDGAVTLMADFGVRVFSTKTDPDVFAKLCPVARK